MTARITTVVIVIVWVMALVTCHVASAWRIDCSKYVYAPKCRGVAAKRAMTSHSSQRDTSNYASNYNNLMKYMTSRYPNPRDDAFMTDDIGTVDDVDDGQWLVGGRVYDNKRWKDDLQQRFVDFLLREHVPVHSQREPYDDSDMA